MASCSQTAGDSITPLKEKSANKNRKILNENVVNSENIDPNVSSPGLNFSNSPSVAKSVKTAKKSTSENPNPNQVACSSVLLKKKIRERKFVIAKKKLSKNQELKSPTAAAVVCEKCQITVGKSKCLCLAYESLRTSQEEFFKDRSEIYENEPDYDNTKECDNGAEITKGKMEGDNGNTDEVNSEMNLKRSRDKLLEEAIENVPEPGSGRVLQLVKAFEKLSVIKLGDLEEEHAEDDNKEIKWALPGLQQTNKVSETQVSSSSLCPSDFFLTSESLGLDYRPSYSLDSSQGSFSSRISAGGGQRSRRNSNESAGTFARRQWRRKQRKATSHKPFMLRTEQRGRSKEEEFMKKLQQMLEEEEKLRIPVAQGLPWTTDEPECLPKPPVKESTGPVDLVLHSDIRAVERSEFDHQVAEKMNLIQQYRMERERQQKLAEEEEVRRLRKELVPKAQPMPYFDRPFIPRRSMKHPTMPKEPKFHLQQHKKIKCYSSLDDFYAQPQ